MLYLENAGQTETRRNISMERGSCLQGASILCCPAMFRLAPSLSVHINKWKIMLNVCVSV